jgi:hypothetical protein
MSICNSINFCLAWASDTFVPIFNFIFSSNSIPDKQNTIFHLQNPAHYRQDYDNIFSLTKKSTWQY